MQLGPRITGGVSAMVSAGASVFDNSNLNLAISLRNCHLIFEGLHSRVAINAIILKAIYSGLELCFNLDRRCWAAL